MLIIRQRERGKKLLVRYKSVKIPKQHAPAESTTVKVKGYQRIM